MWWFVDTAGIRRRAKEASGHEYYATLRTQAALDRAEVAIVLVDASEPLSEQDQRIISMVIDSGRALVIAFNNWDLTDEDRRGYCLLYTLNAADDRRSVALGGRRRINNKKHT